MKNILIPIRKIFAPKITKPLTWSTKDFDKGRKWAKSRLHPEQTDKTIWDVVYSVRKDSTEIIHEINKYINNERDKTQD